MLKPLLLAGFAVAAFAPSLASAQESCQQRRGESEAVGTVLGAVGGALLGNAVSSHGGKPGGTIIGGVGGAVVGNRIAASGTHCGENQYGYYDGGGRWVPRSYTAYGYYGPDGQWVAQAPDGYDASATAYDAPPPPAAYDRGPPPPAAYGYDNNRRGVSDFADRENRMEQSIQRRMSDGSLDDRDGRRALHQLSDIRRMEDRYRYDNGGRLNDQQRADIDQRLDSLRDQVRSQANADQGPPPPRPY